MGVFGKKSMPAGTTAEDVDFASKAASMREAQACTMWCRWDSRLSVVLDDVASPTMEAAREADATVSGTRGGRPPSK